MTNRRTIGRAGELADSTRERAGGWLLGLGSLAAMSLGIVAGNAAVAGGGAWLAGMLVLARLVADLRSGVSYSNWGTWRRADGGRGYVANVAFWTGVMILWFSLGAAMMLGWIPLPSG